MKISRPPGTGPTLPEQSIGRGSRGRYLIQTRGKQIVATAWPRKRGDPKADITKEQNAEFIYMVNAVKDMMPQDQVAARELAAGSVWTWRDLLSALLAMRLYNIPNWGPVVMQYTLDLLSTTPGAIAIRREDGWESLEPGDDNQVLTMQAGMPEWTDLPDPSGGGRSGLYSDLMAPIPTFANTGLSTWRNQGSAVALETSAGLLISAPAALGADQWRVLEKAAPTPPYEVHALIALASGTISGYATAGIGWNDGTKLQLVMIQTTPSFPSPKLYVANYNNVTTFAGSLPFTSGSGISNPVVLSIKDDGTNIAYSWSIDGKNFTPVYSVAKASGFLGASGYTNMMFAVDPNSTNTLGTLMGWHQF